MFTSIIPKPPSKNDPLDQELLDNLDDMLSVGPAGNPGEGINYKSNAGTNLILQNIIDSVLGIVVTSPKNTNQTTKIPLSFGPIQFEILVKISWSDNAISHAKDITVEYEALDTNPLTFSGGFEILGKLIGAPNCRIPGLSLKAKYSPSFGGALEFRYDELSKTVMDVQILNDWQIKYDLEISGALSKALVMVLSTPAATMYEAIDKLLPSGAKLSDIALAGGLLSFQLQTSSLDASTYFTMSGNISTNASISGKQIFRASIAPSISLKWGKDQGGSYYQPTGKISADVNLDFYALTYGKTWDIVNWQNNKTYDVVRIKAPVFRISPQASHKADILYLSTILESELEGPLINQLVSFECYDGTWQYCGSATTQANGQANTTWDVTLDPGVYQIRAKYVGTSRFQTCCSEDTTLFVEETTTKLISPTFNNNLTYLRGGENLTCSVNLTTDDGTPVESEVVRFYYSADRNATWTELGYNSTGSNGIAYFSTPFSPVNGVYYLVAMYAGSTQYQKCAEPLYHEIKVVQNGSFIISPDPLQGLKVERGVNKTYVLHVENLDLSRHLCNITYNASGSAWFTPNATAANISALSGYNFCVNLSVPSVATIQAYTGNFTFYRDNVFYRNFSYQFEVNDFQTSSNFSHTAQILTGSISNSKSYGDLSPAQKTLYSTCLNEILVNVTFTVGASDLIGQTMTGYFRVGSTDYGMYLQYGSGTITSGYNEFWFYLKAGDTNMTCRSYLPGSTEGVSLPISGGTNSVSATIQLYYRTESLVKVTSFFDGGISNLTVNRGDDIKINWRAQGDYQQVLYASLLAQHPTEFVYKSGTFGADPATAQSLGNLSYGTVNNSYTIFTCNTAGIYHIPWSTVTYTAFIDDIRTAYVHTSYGGALTVKVVGSITGQVSFTPSATINEDEQIEIKYYARDNNSLTAIQGLLIFINITQPDATNVTYIMDPIAGSLGWYHLLYKPDQDGTYTYFILAQNDAYSLDTKSGSFSVTGKLEMGAHSETEDQRVLEFTTGDQIGIEVYIWHDGVLETPAGTFAATLKYPSATTRVITISNVGTGRYQALINLTLYFDQYGWTPELGWYEVNFTHSGTGWVTQSNSTFFYVRPPQIFIERTHFQVILPQHDFLLNYTVQPSLLIPSVQVSLDNISKGNLQSPVIFYNLTEGWHVLYLAASDSFGFSTNQSISLYVAPIPEQKTMTLFEENFEHGLSGWNATGLWHLTSNLSNADPFLSPVHSAWCGREETGTYNTGSRVRDNLTSPVINLKRLTNAILKFSTRYTVETGTGYDTATVLVSTNGVDYVSVYTRSSPNQLPSWTEVTINLDSYLGNATVWIRFTFDTVNTAANDYQGWLIDNVKVTTKSWQGASLSSVKVGALTAYGSANPLTQYPTAAGYITGRLASTAAISQPLNLSLLQQYSIIWIDENGSSMPRADLEALMAWVYQGGSIVSSGDNFGTMSDILNYLNISTVSSAAAGGNYSNFTLHDVTEGLTTIYHQAPGCSLNLSLYPYRNDIFPIVVQDGYVQGAAGWYGNGKFVITADEDPFLNSGTQQNALYINKIFGWLSNLTMPRDLLPPSACLVAVNPDPGMEGNFHINATLFDRSGISSATARVRSLCNNETIVALYDDGLHGDGIANDSQYGGNYTTNFDDVGMRYLDLEIVDNSTAANILNISSITTFVVQPGIPRIHEISQNSTFEYIAGGTAYQLSDDGYLQFTLPFAFPFYNSTFSTIYVSNNGWMSFTTTDPSESINVAFPSSNSRYAYAIAPYWNDIAATTTYGLIYAANLTLPGNHHAWVISWQNVYHAGAGSCGTFQVILYESGEVKIQFLEMNDVLANGGYTCGSNLGSNSYACTYSGLVDGTNHTAILFVPIKESTVPGSISGLTALPSSWTNSSSFNVSWTNPWDYCYIGGAYYKLDSAPTSNGDGSLVTGLDLTEINGINVGSTGTHALYVWVIDQANKSDYTTRVSINLYYDGVLPNNPTGCVQVNGTTTSGVWQNTTSDANFTWGGATDADSGVAGYLYYWGTDPAGISSSYTTSTGYDPANVSGSGIYYLRVQTNDTAGNRADWITLYELWYDGTSPSNPIGCVQENGTTTSGMWQNTVSDANFTWSGATDTHSGVAGYFYYWGTDPAGTSSSYTTSTGYDPANVSGSGIYYLRVQTNDSVGNFAGWVTLYELRFDGDVPTNPTPSGCDQTADPTTSGVWQNYESDPAFLWSGASDDDSGVAGYYCYWGEDPAGTSSSYQTAAGFDPSELGSSGTYYLRVRTNDTANNLAAWVTIYEFKYDFIPPTNPTGCVQENGTTTSGVWQNSTNDANFTWSGASDTHSGVAGYYWYWGLNSEGTLPSYYTTTASCDPSAISTGIYFLRVRTNDTAGNLVNSWVTLYVFQYDGIVPTNPTGCTQENGTTTSGVWQNSTNDPNFTWSGALDAHSGVAGYYYYWGTQSAGTSSSYTISAAYDPAAIVGNGKYYLRVQTNDSVGNLATWITIYELWYDGTAPTNPTGCDQTVGSTTSGVWQKDVSNPAFTWSGATDADSGVDRYKTYWGTDPAGTSANYQSDTTFGPVPASSGIYYLRVQTLDAAGNNATWVTLYEFWYDGTFPTNPTPSGCMQVNGSTTSSVWQKTIYDPNFTWSGASDAHSGVAGYYYYWGTESGGTSSSYTTVAAYDPAVIVGSSIYYLRVLTNDSVGNLAFSWVTLYEFWYDITAPNNPDPFGCSQAGTTSGVWQHTVSDPAFTWNPGTDADSGVAGYYTYWGADPAGTSTDYQTGTDYNPTAVTSGIYYLRVQTNDSVGNLAAWATIYEFRYDGTPPTNPTGCDQTADPTKSRIWQNVENHPLFTLSGATDADSGMAGYYYYFGTQSGGACTSYTATDDCDPGAVSSGIYYFRVRARDAAGNLADPVTLYEFWYDGTPPTNPTGCIQTNGTTMSGVWQKTVSDANFTWSGATDAHTGVAGYFYYWGTSATGTSTSYTTSTSFDPEAVGRGTYYLRVRANDTVGNLASDWVTLYVFQYDADWVPPAPEEPPIDLTLYIVIFLVIGAIIAIIVFVARRPKTLPNKGRKLEEIAAKRLKAQQKKAPPGTDRGRALFEATREPLPTPGQPQPQPKPTTAAPQPETTATPTVEEASTPITEEGLFVAAFAASCQFCGEAVQDGKCAFCGAWVCKHCETTNTPAIDKCAKCEKGRWG